MDKILEIRKRYENDYQFLEQYIGKYDCLIGSKESMDYLKSIEEKEKERCQQ